MRGNQLFQGAVPSDRSAANEQPGLILVGFDKHYGTLMCYPANEQARLLASIAGTKTLSRGTLNAARTLGLSVAVAPGSQHFLEDFISGRAS